MNDRIPAFRLVEFLDRMSVIGPSQRQRLIRELPELPNCLHPIRPARFDGL